MSTSASPEAPIQVRIGNEKLCKITEEAAQRIRSLVAGKGLAEGALRIAVVGGGCSGLQYQMDIVPGPKNRDMAVDAFGARVLIDPKSALFVSGSQLDYSNDLQKGGFRMTNPNATAHCSCGASFSA